MRKNIFHLFSSAIFTQKFQFSLPFDSCDTLNFCDLHLFIPQEEDFDPDWLSPQVILLTQICENQGTSVCNAIEFIAPQAVHFLTQNISHFDPYNCVIVEHHNPNSYLNFDEFLETYHIFKQDLGRCYWHNLTKEDFSSLIKGEKSLITAKFLLLFFIIAGLKPNSRKLGNLCELLSILFINLQL